MILRSITVLALALVLAGCNYKGVPDPSLSARDAEFMARVPNAELDLGYERYEVNDPTGEAPGTIIVDTKENFLYLVLPGKRAIRYGVSTGAEAFGWTGTARVARKAEWPRWTPPAEMIDRWPHLRHAAGGMNGRAGESARRARALSLRGQSRHALSHPRHQRAREDRPQRLVRLHPHAQHRRGRPLQPHAGRREGDRSLTLNS